MVLVTVWPFRAAPYRHEQRQQSRAERSPSGRRLARPSPAQPSMVRLVARLGSTRLGSARFLLMSRCQPALTDGAARLFVRRRPSRAALPPRACPPRSPARARVCVCVPVCQPSCILACPSRHPPYARLANAAPAAAAPDPLAVWLLLHLLLLLLLGSTSLLTGGCWRCRFHSVAASPGNRPRRRTNCGRVPTGRRRRRY